MVEPYPRPVLSVEAKLDDIAGLARQHVDALWAAWNEQPGPALREQLIEFYLPFARMLAAKSYARRTYMELEFMDYLQSASVGLLEAIDRFNPARGVSFETFASVRIKGAILSGIETLSEKQEQVSARKRMIDSRVQTLDQESANRDDVFSHLADLAIGLALGFVLEDTGMMYAELEPQVPDTTYHAVEMKQMQQRLHQMLATLPDNEKRVLTYHYLQHLGFDEVAQILQVGKSRVSQLHKQGLLRLRGMMQPRDGVDLHY